MATVYGKPSVVLLVLTIIVFVLYHLVNYSFSGSRTGSGEISMLTFNILYTEERMEERMEALGKVVQDLDPDFLTFQEVTLDNLALLQKQHPLTYYHLIPPAVTPTKDKHFLVIFSRKAVHVNNWAKFSYQDTPFDRYLLLAETKSERATFVIANTHLEHSRKNMKFREKHLGEALKILSKYENVCVMGDMNIRLDRDGEVFLPSSWIDAWLSLPGNTDSNGYTANPTSNPYGGTDNKVGDKSRLDRVYCKLSDFKVKEMRVIREAKSGVRPSDHFGVYTVIKPSVKTGSRQRESLGTENENVYFKSLGTEK